MGALTIIGAILALGFLIVVHEAGHYIVARWCKMRVDRFSLGFGPPIFSRRHGETDFTIGPIPFGGFVHINGMLITEEVDPDDERAYPNRPVWQRFATIFAGPATNYLAAIALAFVFYNAEGVRASTARYVIAGVVDSDQFDARDKLEPNDVVLRVNGDAIYGRFKGASPAKLFVDYVQEAKDQPLQVTVHRGGKELDVLVTPRLNPEREEPNQPRYRLGVSLDFERADVGVIGAAGHAVAYPVRQTKMIIIGLYEWATGRQQGHLTSVVGITAEVKRQIDRGWTYLIQILMLLNVYLGLFNLFPLPALDGGRLVFLGYEMVTRRRANPKIESMVHMVGIMALMLLLIVVTYKDCAREFF